MTTRPWGQRSLARQSTFVVLDNLDSSATSHELSKRSQELAYPQVRPGFPGEPCFPFPGGGSIEAAHRLPDRHRPSAGIGD